MDEIITMVLSALLTLIGRFFLRAASLGQWKCEPMSSDAHASTAQRAPCRTGTKAGAW